MVSTRNTNPLSRYHPEKRTLISIVPTFYFLSTKHVIESINLRTVDFMQTFQKLFFKQVIQLNCFLFFFPNVMKFSSFLSNSMILLFLAILRLLDNLLHFWSERTTTSYNVILIQKKFEWIWISSSVNFIFCGGEAKLIWKTPNRIQMNFRW